MLVIMTITAAIATTTILIGITITDGTVLQPGIRTVHIMATAIHG